MGTGCDETMRAAEFITEVKIDNRGGLGAVPYNADVDYFGLKVTMKPSMFLRLGLPLDANDPEEQETIQYLRQQIDDPGFGAPFLTITVPQAWEDGDFNQEARVRDHDGRHRMYAILDQQGDAPVETHLFLSHFRRRDITDDIIDHLRDGMLNQSGHYVSGPIFGEAQ
jgi:hypothetical protein